MKKLVLSFCLSLVLGKNAKELFGNMKNVRFDDDEC